MATKAPSWTATQVYNQLFLDDPNADPAKVEGSKWDHATITYSFPTDKVAFYQSAYQKAGPGKAPDYIPVAENIPELWPPATFKNVDKDHQAFFILAISTWDDLISSSFKLIADTSKSYKTSDIEFAYAESSAKNFYAQAYMPPIGTAWFNVKGPSGNQKGLLNPTVDSYDFETLVHEIGHALGLNHTGTYNGEGPAQPSAFQDSTVLTIMSYFGPNEGQGQDGVQTGVWLGEGPDKTVYYPQTPMYYDIYAIQKIYGVSTTTRTGNTTYGFNSNITGDAASIYNFSKNKHPILSLFDSNGIDTLDLSGWNTKATVSLVTGHLGSFNGMTHNFSIAFGTVIENLVGGGGNDKLTGNKADNSIRGGAGNDTIDGGEGNDILFGNAGNDGLTGGLGDDDLVGGVGNDNLDGGPGNDSLYGEGGVDTAVYSGKFADYKISYDPQFQKYTISGTASGTDTVTEVENFKFSNGVYSAGQLVPKDTTAPTLLHTSPADNATAVARNANLVLTMSEKVIAGSGKITIFKSGGTPAEAISVTDTTKVTINGAVVTINPGSNLTSNTAYYVNVAAGALKDYAGNPYAGFSSKTLLNFTTSSVLADASDAVGDFAGFAAVVGAAADDYASDTGTSGVVVVNGAASTGVVETAGDTDLFKVNLTAGTIYAFTLSSAATGGLFDPYLYLLDSRLEVVGEDDESAGGGNARIAVQAPATGTYYLKASDYDLDVGTGAYTLSAATIVDDYAESKAGVVTVNGAPTSAAIDFSGDYDDFEVTLTAGVTYAFSMTAAVSLQTDAYLELYDAAGNYIDYDDESAGDSNALLIFTAKTSGTYYLSASDYDKAVGGYTLSATEVDTTVPALKGLSPADGSKTVTAGANIVLTFIEPVAAGTGNILIYNASGTVAHTIDILDETQVSIVDNTVTVNPDGDLVEGASYYVNVQPGALTDIEYNAFPGIAGATAYDFTVAIPAPDDFPMLFSTSGVVVVNSTGTSGGINNPDDGDLFKITLVAGTNYVFSLKYAGASLLDPYLVLYSSDPTQIRPIASDDDGGGDTNSQIQFTPDASGVYYLAAHDYDIGTGAYVISAITVTDDYPWSEDTTGVVAVNDAATAGTIDFASDYDLLKVTLTAGVSYVFDLTRQASGLEDPYLYLIDSSFDVAAEDDESGGAGNARIEYTAAASGTYFLGVADYDIGVGAYRLSAATGSAATTGQTVRGSIRDDSITAAAGQKTIDGGDGIDTVLYSGSRSGFALAKNSGGFTLTDTKGMAGPISLTNIERLQFGDTKLALDLDGHAGQAAKLMGAVFGPASFTNMPGAVFGPASLTNKQLVGIGLSLLDSGWSYEDLAKVAVDYTGKTKNADVAGLLWANVMGSAPTVEQAASITAMLEGGMSIGRLAVLAAELSLNADNIHLVGLSQTGIEFG